MTIGQEHYSNINLVTLYEIGEVSLHLVATEWFSCKGRERKICCHEVVALSSEHQV